MRGTPRFRRTRQSEGIFGVSPKRTFFSSRNLVTPLHARPRMSKGEPNETQTSGEPPDLGVLFVHGVGHQSTGATLVKFGDPLLRWIDNWFQWGLAAEMQKAAKTASKKESQLTEEEIANLSCGWAKVHEARVKGEEGTPAHAEVELNLLRNGEIQSNRWLFAESCWANAFVAPTFTALAFWGLVVYPWTNAVHFGAQMRRRWRRALQSRNWFTLLKTGIVTAASFVGSVLISIIVLAVLLLLIVLAIPPIPSLRAMLLRTQQRLADSLGDSFILAASPIQKAAIVSHVRRDLEWLMSRGCRKVAVVAHSQGAAVAFETLATGVVKGRQSDDTLLVTFGSGLGKLYEVERAIGSDKARMGWMPIIGLALIVAALEFFNVIDLFPFLGRSMGFGLCLGWVGVILWLAGVVYSAWGNRPKPEEFEPSKKFDAEVTWRDYYASKDLVPNGTLLDEDPSFLQSEEVHNRASLWSDHTTYWLNCDQFVPAVLRDLGSLANFLLLNIRTGDEELVATAARRRKWRVRWLAGARLAMWITAGLIVINRMSDLPKWGAAALDKLPVLEKILGWFLGKDLVSGKLAADPLAQRGVGIALVITTAAAGYYLLYVIWQIWTWWDKRALMRRTDYGSETPYWVFVLASLALTDAGIFVSLGWFGEKAFREGGEAMDWVWYPLIPAFLAAMAIFIVGCLRDWGNPPFTTLLVGAVAALLMAPFMVVMLTAHCNEWIKLTVLAASFILTCLFILFGDALILPERQEWNNEPARNC
jgi:hypothetical protein